MMVAHLTRTFFDLGIPRKYPWKATRGANGGRYNKEELKAAVLVIQQGQNTIKEAAVQYNIPRTTLKHHVRCTRGKIDLMAESCKGGGVATISDEDEKMLVEGLLTMEKWGFGLEGCCNLLLRSMMLQTGLKMNVLERTGFWDLIRNIKKNMAYAAKHNSYQPRSL
ncbi:uncharacterized protein LOC130897540 [Diorhabda carinulata]|uniref:uncharacterized protein LOC130897540 n=1 Tax=Diorhabda carinulata TaxID=1163345 RepID=UPI0025A26623|nr:uncharacterized protein LOC130897540 [Diorhabda carinulata]